MHKQISPNEVSLTVKQGFERMKNYRNATAMFVKEYVGNYYGKQKGISGQDPINLLFHTIRTLVPNLVMQNPTTKVVTPYKIHRDYAELLGLGLDELGRQTDFKEVLRAWITSAFFGWGILKTGIAAKGHMLKFGDITVDPGQIYTELIDLDDFVIDPICKSIKKSMFYGHQTMVSRQILLDTDIYNHDLVAQLPGSKSMHVDKKVSNITQHNMSSIQIYNLQDYVDVVELYVPEADAIVTIPDPRQQVSSDYIGVADFYGSKSGPYTFLSFTPPVQGNPFPIAPVSMYYDLHKMANRTFTRSMDQADRQKDILLYNPALADSAQDIKEADDGDVIACPDPKGINLVSYGGQNIDNAKMLGQLQIWFNYMSGNPDQMSGNKTPGTRGGKETATRSNILQSNANISLEDARDILYDATARVKKKEAWYFHNDPFISLPLTKRVRGNEEIQLELTPEQRQGDFLEFTFQIVQRSMSRLDPNIRSKRIIEFGTNVLPAAVNAAMIAMQVGFQFNLERYLTNIGEELGIGIWVQEMFDDPDYQRRLQIMMALGPQNQGKAGGSSPEGVEQNKGFPGKRNIMSPTQEANQFAQQTAAESQSANQGIY